MSWQAIKPEHPKHGGWNRRDAYELRLTSKTMGYLNARSREFLFGPGKAGMVIFEKEDGSSGNMSIVPAQSGGLKVNGNGHLSVAAITNLYPLLPLPVTIKLVPFEDEKRLVFAGIK